MFPIRDENPTLHLPLATYVLLGLNIAAWILVQGLGSQMPLADSICTLGLIPAELLGHVAPGTRIPLSERLACVLDGDPAFYTPLSSMFLHGSWLHIIGNLWFLWVFGDNVEDVMGPIRYALFYLLCGLAAAAAQVMVNPESLLPMVGASGAIGGIMGAYARLYPRVQIQTLLILGFYVTVIAVPAVFMLGYWFLLQFLSGLPALGSTTGGVAFWAHVGGFVSGAVLAPLFVDGDLMAAHRRAERRQPRNQQ
jgi:membrane associated rhomboid family serine protease